MIMIMIRWRECKRCLGATTWDECFLLASTLLRWLGEDDDDCDDDDDDVDDDNDDDDHHHHHHL